MKIINQFKKKQEEQRKRHSSTIQTKGLRVSFSKNTLSPQPVPEFQKHQLLKSQEKICKTMKKTKEKMKKTRKYRFNTQHNTTTYQRF